MAEVNLRIANFFKTFSMFMVLGSLLYMYAYASDRVSFLNTSRDWISELPKTYIFYFGLGFFAIINLVVNAGIVLYKNTAKVDRRSVFFRSKAQKEKMLLWFTLLLAGINSMIACIVVYLALTRINEATDRSEYIYIPVIGLILLVTAVTGLISAFVKK